MTTAEKSEAILKRILEVANKGSNVGFEADFGDNTITIFVGDAHTHCGIPGEDGTFDLLVDNLYNCLHNGPHLSFAPAPPEVLFAIGEKG